MHGLQLSYFINIYCFFLLGYFHETIQLIIGHLFYFGAHMTLDHRLIDP